MPDSAILRPSSGSWLDRGRGIRTFNIVTRTLGGKTFLSGITEFEPGSEIPAHYHNCEESVTILEGTGTFEIGGQFAELKPFDSTWISAGIPHRFLNSGTNRLRILWTYGSAQATRTLVSTGLEIRVGDPGDVYPEKGALA